MGSPEVDCRLEIKNVFGNRAKTVNFGELVLVGDVGIVGTSVDVLNKRTVKVSPVCLNLA